MEWSIVVAVIATLGFVLGRQKDEIQAKAELAAVKYTLGSLRTALILDYMQRTVRAGNGAPTSARQNPFDLLERKPANFQGEVSAAQASRALAGSWVFDPACPCVGYRPHYSPGFNSASGDDMAWFKLAGAPGPLELTARESYVWQGTALR